MYFTVTLHLALRPLGVETVMVAVPGRSPAVTSPFSSTLAMEGLLLLQVRARSAGSVLAGSTEAVRRKLSP